MILTLDVLVQPYRQGAGRGVKTHGAPLPGTLTDAKGD